MSAMFAGREKSLDLMLNPAFFHILIVKMVTWVEVAARLFRR